MTYYPGEAARILGLDTLDYHQMRRLFAIIDPSLGEEAARAQKKWTWTRYSFRHLVAMRTALRLAPPDSGGRLDIRLLQRACSVLREHFGSVSPLTDIQLERLGDTIVARVGGRLFDATTGQRLIAEVVTSVRNFVSEHCDRDEAKACLQQAKQHTRDLRSEAPTGRAKFLAATSRGGK